MSAVEEILAQKPKTFEAAERGSVREIMRMRLEGTAPSSPLATDPRSFRPRIVREPLVVEGEGVGFAESLKQGFIDDIDTRIRRLAEQKFPGDPNAVDRFGVIDNEIVFVNDRGQLEAARSGAPDVAGSAAAMAPEVLGSVAGTFTPFPVAGSAAGAAIGRGLKDLIGEAFLEDKDTPMGVVTNMFIEAGLDVGAGAIGKLGTKLLRKKAIRGLNEDVFKSEAKRQAINAATGIELDLAQVTNLPKLKALKLWARNFPGEASEIIKANDDLIAGQVDDAITRVLDTVAKETDTSVLGVNAINAAQAAITGARAEVAAKVSPLYQQAFDSGASVNIDPVVKLIDDKLKTAKGSREKRLMEVRKALKISGKKEFDRTVQGLHASKMAIDEMFERRGSEALGSTIKRDLVEVKGALLDQLSAASPAYDQARKTFEAETARLVDPLQNGIVGVLANVKDERAATAAAKMFSDGNVNAAAIERARNAIKRQDPEAWRGIVKQWLMHQFNAASKELQTGEKLNVAGKFRQRIMGTNAQKEAMRAAIGPEAKELFELTMQALEFAARTPTSSSATEFNRLITQELTSNVGSITRAIVSPRETGVRAIEEAHLQKQARRVAEALTDPSKVAQLKSLTPVSESALRASIAGAVIGLSILPRDAAGNILFPEDTRIPPVLEQE